MESITELQATLKKLKGKWDSGKLNIPHEIVRLDREMKELKKKIQAIEG